MLSLPEPRLLKTYTAKTVNKTAVPTKALRKAVFSLQVMLMGKNWRKNEVSKMTEKTTTYNPAKALVDDEEIAFFMADAFETGDASYIAKALDVVAQAKGMTASAISN